MDRRNFVQAGILLPGLSLAPWLTAAAATARTAPPLELFVYDERAAEAVASASRHAARGVALAAVNGDLMSLWYDELDLKWQAQPMTLGGATRQDALFVLETFALDRGMRVIHRQPIPHSGVVEWIIAPRDFRALTASQGK